MKKIMLIIIMFIINNLQIANAVPCDIFGHWCEKNIIEFYNQGIISGYPDGNFYPDKEITRIELFSIINHYFNYDIDENSDWIYENLRIAKEKGYADIKNIYDGLSREETFVIYSNLFNVNLDIDIDCKYTDVQDISLWANDAVMSLTFNNVISGYPEGMLKPKKNITRAEVVQLFSNLTLKDSDNVVEKIENSGIKICYIDHNEFGIEIKEFPDELEVSVGDEYQIVFVGVDDEVIENELIVEILYGEDNIIYDNNLHRLEIVGDGSVIIKIQIENYKKIFFINAV